MSAIYLGRDNVIRYALMQDGSPVAANTVTRAQFTLPPEASVAGTEVVLDTSVDAEATLTDSATVLSIKAGGKDLVPGRYKAFITVFDSLAPNGIAWGKDTVSVYEWLPDL